MNASTFIITAKRSNGETVYLRDVESHGTRMVPSAQDIAARFDSRLQAAPKMIRAMREWWGLSKWRVERLEVGK